ncbi:MAG: AI-2E family transporter [Pricia sp.]
MKRQSIARDIIKAVLFFLIAALILYVLYRIRTLIIYITIATVLALLGRPFVLFLHEKFLISRTIGAVITILLILAIAAGLAAMFVPMLTEQGRNLALYDFDGIRAEIDKFYEQISNYTGTSKEAVEEAIEKGTIEEETPVDSEEKAVPSLLERVLGILTELGIALFSVLFMAFFMLRDPGSFQRFLLASIPPAHRDRTVGSLNKIRKLLSRYLLGLVLQISILFIVYAITLYFVGTESALVVAFFCALFNIVPYIGPIVGAVLMVLLTISSHGGMDFSQELLPLVSYVMIGVTIGQLIDNFFSQPYIYSSSIRSHPVEIFIIIIAAGLLFGVVGMMIAVPIYAVAKVVLREFLQDNGFVRSWTKGI